MRRTKRSARKPSARKATAAPVPEQVSIEVLLAPSPEGRSPFTAVETICHSNVENFLPSAATRDQAMQRLARRDFKIVAVSPYSLSVEGTPELFTQTFGTELEVRHQTRVQTAHPMRMISYFAPAEEAAWERPSDLLDVIERAYIQPPAIYFESALPPRVRYYHLNAPGDVAMLTRASEVHREGITGKGVKVVMVDSGFYWHPFYKQRGYRAEVTLAPDAQNTRRDDNGHGTAEAANVFAIAPDVSFVMIKQGRNSTAAFKKAIDLNPDIITCSWGYDLVNAASSNRRHLPRVPNTLRALELEVARAVARGIVVVFSAGNGHVSFPGMHPDVISIGGVFVDADLSMRASDYASAFDSRPYPGRHVPDLCGLVGMQPHAIYIMLPLQPGCEIDMQLALGGAFPGGDETQSGDGWTVISGTSAAAPQLAAVCALLLQKNPKLTPQEIKQVLLTSARDCSDGTANAASNEGVALPASGGVDGATGHGLVDAAAAVKLI
ncbi:MAG: S8 family serine peptidase [Acidobacteria bacterium]|nr:S8 family serine peptidase [Acidobacteriota bacterium]